MKRKFSNVSYHVSDLLCAIYPDSLKNYQIWNDYRNLFFGVKYDAIKYVHLKPEDLHGIEGWWIACNHNFVIADFQSQVWKDFDLLYPETVEVWEKFLLENKFRE